MGACGGGEDENEDEESSQSESDQDNEEDDASQGSRKKDSDADSGDKESSTSGESTEESDSTTTGDESTDDTSTGGTEPTGDTSSDGSSSDSTEENLNDYCKDVIKWDPAWTKLEDEILKLVNEFRAKGGDCGLRGKFKATGPVTLDAKLRCAARVHSKDMGDKNYFEHMNKEGESPFVRIKKAGFQGRTSGENIAAGNVTAQATMDQWIKSDGHCANMMNPKFTKLGVGYYPKPSAQYRHYWTQNFGG